MKVMNKKNLQSRRTRNQKITWSNKEKRVFLLIGLAFVSIIFFVFRNNLKEDQLRQNAYMAFIGKEVPDSMVCMVSGVVKPEAIHSINVEGKIYWGCCDKCLNKLKINSGNVLYATDPISGKTISKSDSYIRLNEENKKLALFFESEDTYKKYISTVRKE